MVELDKTGIHGDNCPCDGPMCVAQRADEALDRLAAVQVTELRNTETRCCLDCDYHDTGKQSADGDPEGYGDVLELNLIPETPTQRAHCHARNEQDRADDIRRRERVKVCGYRLFQSEPICGRLSGNHTMQWCTLHPFAPTVEIDKPNPLPRASSTFTLPQLRAAIFHVADTGDLCSNCPTPVIVPDEDVLEAVTEIMEMNGLSTGSNGSGWELKDLLEHAADTEAILRRLISRTTTGGEAADDDPATPHPWHFDPLDESEGETDRRTKFVDAVCVRLKGIN